MRTLALAVAAMAVWVATSGAGFAGEKAPPRIAFAIERQPLAAALTEFARQAHVQILRRDEDVALDGLVAPGVAGELSVEEALKRILSRTGLTYEFVNDRTVRIARPATPAAEEGGKTTFEKTAWVTASHSAQSFRMAEGRLRDGEEAAKQLETDQRQQDREARTKGVEEVVVTGSRLKSNSALSSVITFDRRRIEELGVNSVGDLFDYLPQQSFAFNEQSRFGGSKAVQLRGLGLGTTLVLIDGRRTVTSALQSGRNFFDLNAVPLAAVERVDVLTDAASAIYGADAVGGVVNIVLKKNLDRPTLDLYYGGADGGGDERRVSLSGGHATNRSRFGVVLDYFDRGFLLGNDREFFSNADFRRFGGSDQRLAFSNPGNISSRTSANLPGLPSRIAAVPIGSTGVGLTPSDFLATAGKTNLFSVNQFQSVVPEAERFGVLAYANVDLPSFSVFAEGLYGHRNDTSRGVPSLLNNTLVPATNPFNPFGQAVNVTYLFTQLGPQTTEAKTDSYRATLGARGNLSSWQWEMSVLGIKEDGDSVILNRADTARVNSALAATDPSQALNVFQDGPGGSSDLLRSLVGAPTVNNYYSNALQPNAFMSGTLFRLPAGNVEAVLGGEFRREKIHFESRPTLVMSADRRSAASFAELRVPLVSHNMNIPAIDRLSVSLAGRYDHYNDFGGSTNGLYGIEWTVVSSLMIRGSYTTSFRPPSLFELYQPPTTFAAIIPDPRRNNQNTSLTNTQGGNTDLIPEKAKSWTAGFVFTPAWSKATRFSATYWNIAQEQRIVRTSAVTILANELSLAGRVVRAAPTPADVAAGLPGTIVSIDATSLNAGRLDTSGVDFEITHAYATSWGRITPDVLATWVRKYDVADFLNTPLLDLRNVANTQGTVTTWKASAGVTWAWRAADFMAVTRFTPSHDDATTANVRNGRRVGSQTYVDAQLSVRVGDLIPNSQMAAGLVARVGARNLLDEEPEYSQVGGSLGLDASLADTRQRFLYISLSKSFR